MRLNIRGGASLPSILGPSLIAGLALSAIALFVYAEPHDALVKADVIGFATCHRIPERSLHVDGHQLPLCARCTGIYIGMLAGWLWLIARRRTHAAQLPARPIVVALIGFVALMGIDGLNSTATLIGLPHPYETENWMRVFTGSLYGLAISLLVTPFITAMLWREPTGERTLKGWGELLVLVNVTAVMVMVVLTGAAFLLWPLVLVSVAGVVGLLSMMNVSLLAAATGKVNTFSRWRALLVPGAIAVALALIEIVAIAATRAAAF